MIELYPNEKYLYCPFEDKDECKSLGGCWDSEKYCWYIPKGVNNKNFEKWFYPYKNENNYIQKNIINWFLFNYNYKFPKDDIYHNNVGVGIGKWLIITKKDSTDVIKLEYLLRKPGIEGYKIWQDQRINVKDHFSSETASICIYCGYNNQNFEEQKEWIKYIGYKLSKDLYLKNLSIRKQLYFKLNEETRQFNYSFNSSNTSKLSISFE